MRRQLLTGLVMTVVLTVLLGIVYPLAVFAVGQVAFNDRANGSFVKSADGTVVGSSLIGQSFTDADGNALVQYFQPRPSAAGSGYDAMSSSASNLGPGNPKLIAPADGPDCYLVDKTDDNGDAVLDAAGNPVQECYGDTVPARVAAYRTLNGLADDVQVPVDAVTASGSGLDPQISVANAKLQAPRVAQSRSVPVDTVLAAVDRHTQGRQWGFLGEKVVNVLELNLDLDRQG
jgi:potassium-transporting ATPase KdpC subunit